MSATVTEKWSGKVRGLAANNKDQDQRIFTVIGATSGDDALAALAASTYAMTIDSAFSTGSSSLCYQITARQLTAIGAYELTANFAIPDTGSWTTGGNPLTQPWQYLWQTVIVTEPFDRDIEGNPIVNSARDAFGNPPTKTITYKQLKITRNVQFYDLATYKVYENCVNSDTIVMFEPNGNTNTFVPGTIKCVSIEPGRAYTKRDRYVPMVFTFELYDSSQITLTEPFQLHVLDQGSAGFWDDGGTATRGNIVNKDLVQVSQDVRLNGKGKPMDATMKIGKGKTPVGYGGGTGTAPTGSTIEQPTADATYLRYKRYKAVALLVIMHET